MKITIQTPDFKASQQLLDFVSDRLDKLDHLNNRVIEGRVCLKLDKSSTRDNKICEIRLVIPGDDLFVEQKSESFEMAATQAVQAVKHKLVKWKEKLKE
jgi:putative sigma-54 modulation protein